jgi:hypothetical protein
MALTRTRRGPIGVEDRRSVEVRRPIWLMVVGATALVFAGAVVGCAPGIAQAPMAVDLNGRWTTRTIDSHRLSLSVPSNWNVSEAWIQPSSFSDLVGSFSNQSLSPPCTTAPNMITCGDPLMSLQPGAMLVEIWQNGSPQWTIDSQPGTATIVSGLPARVDVETGGHGYCAGLAADRTRSEVIPFPDTPDNYLAIVICSRGVDDAAGAKVMASVRVTPTV